MQNTLVRIMIHTYLTFCMCYSQSVYFIEFPIDFCMHGYNTEYYQNVIIILTLKIRSNLCVDKTYFLKP